MKRLDAGGCPNRGAGISPPARAAVSGSMSQTHPISSSPSHGPLPVPWHLLSRTFRPFMEFHLVSQTRVLEWASDAFGVPKPIAPRTFQAALPGFRMKQSDRREEGCGRREGRCGRREEECGRRETTCDRREEACGRREEGCGRREEGCGRREEECSRREARCGRREEGCRRREHGFSGRQEGCGRRLRHRTHFSRTSIHGGRPCGPAAGALSSNAVG
jgi:hypothetical protein